MVSESENKNTRRKNNYNLVLLDISFFTAGVKCNIFNKDEDDYYFELNNREFRFKMISDTNIINSNNLLNEDLRNQVSLYDNLRILANGILLCPKMYFNEIPMKKNPVSLIEYEDNSVKYILDYSNNIIMNKEDYIELYNPNLKEISDIEIYKMIEVYQVLSQVFPKIEEGINAKKFVKIYNEILNDINKNAAIFKVKQRNK